MSQKVTFSMYNLCSALRRRMVIYKRQSCIPWLGLWVLLCSVIGTVAFATDASAQPFARFRIPTEYALGANGVAVAEADYDGDGDPDVAIVTEDSGLTLAWNDGAGVFSLQATDVVVPVDPADEIPRPTDVRTGDLDGNGFEDLLIYTSPSLGPNWYQGCVVTVVLNAGDGTFAVESTVSAEPNTEANNISSCNGLEVADYNADGALDFVLAYTAFPLETFDGFFGAFNVFLGNGNGTFAAPSVHSLSSSGPWASYAVATGDLNGDAVTDLVFGADQMWTSGSQYHQVDVWTGDGNGGFTSTFTAPITGYPTTFTEAAVQDYTGDGLVDIVLGENVSISGGYDPVELPVVLLANLGDGTFAAPVEIAREIELVSSYTDDFNGDGLSDLVTLNRRGELAEYSGVPAGLAARPRRSSVGPLRSSAAADFNGDGRTDVAAIARNQPVLTVVSSDAFGLVAPRLVRLPNAGDRAHTRVGDFNRDGFPDVIASYYSEVSVLFGNEAGDYTPGVAIGIGMPPMPPLVADLNSDQNLDVVLPNDAFGFTTVFGTADGSFGGALVRSDGREYVEATLGDMDGDGDLDLAAFQYGTDQPGVDLFLNDGAGNFSWSENIPVSDLVATLRVLDLNADGAQDLFVGASSWGRGDSLILLGDGSGAFGGLITWPVFSGGFDFADLNQDGILDVATSNSIALGDGTGSFGALTVVDAQSQGLKFADFDADGVTDLLTYRYTSVGLLPGNGDGTFGLTTALNVHPPGSTVSAGVADLNGDGLSDVYLVQDVYESSSGSTVELFLLLNTTPLVPAEEEPTCPSKPGHAVGWWSKHWRHPFAGFWGKQRWTTTRHEHSDKRSRKRHASSARHP
jgi:hypothetical protein